MQGGQIVMNQKFLKPYTDEETKEESKACLLSFSDLLSQNKSQIENQIYEVKLVSGSNTFEKSY